jgi:hypothetical protein
LPRSDVSAQSGLDVSTALSLDACQFAKADALHGYTVEAVLTEDLEIGYAAEAVVPVSPARVLVPAAGG